MIRKLREADIAAVAGLWLDTNLKAHGFVPAEYWRSNYEPVKAMLPEAEVLCMKTPVRQRRLSV